MYPPRIDLDFRLSHADGSVVREGHRELRDAAVPVEREQPQHGPLRFEKALLDGWLAARVRRAALESGTSSRETRMKGHAVIGS